MDIPETDSEDEIPPGWEERCTADGLVFYANHDTSSTQWRHPRTGKKKKVTGKLPYGWERQITDDGKILFVDARNNKTTYIDPRLAFAVEETQNISDLRQKFDASSSGFHVIHGTDMTDQIAVITGANSGIGFETARTLCYHGCQVVFACRDINDANQRIAKLSQERPYSRCQALYLDLASFTSVKSFSKEFIERFGRCDILILNAGIFGAPFSLTEDGYESTFQVNYLSHLYLALLLQTVMTRGLSSTGRIVFVAAEAHRFSALTDEARLNEILNPSKADYLPTLAYNNSKLCCILGCFELHRRFADFGLKCFAVHPGNAVCTRISRHWWVYRLIFALIRPFAKSTQQACAPTIYASVSPDVVNCSGMYINNCVPCMPTKAALNPILSNKIWNYSLNLIEQVMGKNAFNLKV